MTAAQVEQLLHDNHLMRQALLAISHGRCDELEDPTCRAVMLEAQRAASACLEGLHYGYNNEGEP